MSLKAGFLFFSLIIVFCESSVSLKKCSIRDVECQRGLYQSVMQEIAKTGIKELGIPPIDPMALKNMSVSLLGVLDLTLVEGTVTGLSNCKLNSLITDIERNHVVMDFMCNVLAVKGRYKAFSDSFLVKPILGEGTIRGDGVTKMKLEKLHLKIEYDFEVVRDRGEEIYFKVFCTNTTSYSYVVLGKALFYIDHFLVGDKDLSKNVTEFLNEDVQFTIKSFGEPFMEKAVQMFSTLTLKFFNAVPTRHFILEDLTPYLNFVSTLNKV